MRIKLSYKLFGAFLLIIGIVSGAMLLSRHIFELNFKTYIRQMETERLSNLVPELQKAYHDQGGWETLRANPRPWLRLIRHSMNFDPPPPPVQEFESDGFNPPTNAPSGPPPGKPPGGPPGGPPGRPVDVLLMDADKQPVIGRADPIDATQLVAIEVDGQVVGWLGLHKREHFKSGPPAALLKRQAKQLFLLGGVVVGLTALIALLFSKHLLRPIQRLTLGTRELAALNFTIRIQPATRDELGQLAENFNIMAGTLEKSEAMRRQWLSDISHELRTPLAVLRGEIEALQDGVRPTSPENLASLHAEMLRISRLVDDLHLLSLADSDSLYLNKQWMSPFNTLQIILKNFHPRITQCQLQLETALDDIRDVALKGDTDRLGQVFTNILENACRYVQSPGNLKISGQADAHFLTLHFQDSGPGVPEAALPRLFDRLFRVESSRNRESGGSGLGLSICRHIVESHNGRIWAQKSPMGGLAIIICLPLTP